MPIKRRRAKRRIDIDAELEVWGSVFDTGYDFFGELKTLDVATNAYGRPDSDAAAEAWERLREPYLASRNSEDANASWAVAEFDDAVSRAAREAIGCR